MAREEVNVSPRPEGRHEFDRRRYDNCKRIVRKYDGFTDGYCDGECLQPREAPVHATFVPTQTERGMAIMQKLLDEAGVPPAPTEEALCLREWAFSGGLWQCRKARGHSGECGPPPRQPEEPRRRGNLTQDEWRAWYFGIIGNTKDYSDADFDALLAAAFSEPK